MRLSDAKGAGLGRDIGHSHHGTVPQAEAISSSYLEWGLGGGRQGSLEDILNDFSCWQKMRKSFQNETWPFAWHGTGCQRGPSNSSLMRKNFVFVPQLSSLRIAPFSCRSAGKLPLSGLLWALLANSSSRPPVCGTLKHTTLWDFLPRSSLVSPVLLPWVTPGSFTADKQFEEVQELWINPKNPG